MYLMREPKTIIFSILAFLFSKYIVSIVLRYVGILKV